MKRKMYFIMGLVAFCTFPFFSQKDSNTDIGIITENRDVPNFDAINIDGRFKVELYKDANHQITVTAPEKLMAVVETKVVNGVLNINMIGHAQGESPNFFEEQKTKRNDYLIREPIKIKIGISGLKSIQAKGASNIESEDMLSLTDLAIDFSGATKGDLKCNINNMLTVLLSGAARLEIEGVARAVSVTANGASVFDGEELRAEDVKVELKGASRAEVLATESIDANLSGASKLVCTGSPGSVKQQVSRGSSITIR